MRNEFGVERGEVLLNEGGFWFDLWVMEVYGWVEWGGRLWRVRKEMINGGKVLFEGVKEWKVKVWRWRG